jgi:hypothetical protein
MTPEGRWLIRLIVLRIEELRRTGRYGEIADIVSIARAEGLTVEKIDEVWRLVLTELRELEQAAEDKRLADKTGGLLH